MSKAENLRAVTKLIDSPKVKNYKDKSELKVTTVLLEENKKTKRNCSSVFSQSAKQNILKKSLPKKKGFKQTLQIKIKNTTSDISLSVTKPKTTGTKLNCRRRTELIKKVLPKNQKIIDVYFKKILKSTSNQGYCNSNKDQSITIASSGSSDNKSEKRGECKGKKRLFKNNENAVAVNSEIPLEILICNSDNENFLKKGSDVLGDQVQPEQMQRTALTNGVVNICSDSEEELSIKSFVHSKRKISSTTTLPSRRKKRECPPYKTVLGTTFAVDAFQYGLIEGVTVYFLTHFHADHYIGLTKSFQMPIYLSSITANLVTAFIRVDPKYLHIIDVNNSQIIDDIEVTALDANHCPGAIMFLYKLKTGKCILHTGDFRASADMESEPIFWNNKVNVVYLDTTYILNSYAFRPQCESVSDAIEIIKKFKEKHNEKRILYICGAYLIGKERFWSEIAKQFKLTVWTECRRKKALDAINNEDFLALLHDNPVQSDMHLLTMGKLSYLELKNYFDEYKDYYDILLAIRPSGWEKHSKPQYRGNINIIGVEYSEHSSHEELKRFVQFLKPDEVISTVPIDKNLMKTSTVPLSWFRYDKLRAKRRFQTCITTYLNVKKCNAVSVDPHLSFVPEAHDKLLLSQTNGCEKKSDKSYSVRASNDWMS